MAHFSKLSLILFVYAVATGCNMGNDEETDVLEGNVNLLVAEAHENPGEPPSIAIRLETERDEPCANVEIINDFTFSNDMITNDLGGVLRPEFCAQPGSPAITTNFIDMDEGEYLLEINYEEQSDLYHINVTTDSITAETETASFTGLIYDVAWRIPENSFAVLCGTIDGETAPCDDFDLILNDNLVLEELTFPDRGYVPYPESTTGTGYNAPGLYYIYGDPSDFEQAALLLQDFANEINPAVSGVAIFLINWEWQQYAVGP